MKRQITHIQTQQRHSSRCMIYLDEEPYQEVDKGLITKFGLRVGLEIEEETLQSLIEQDELPRAKRYAFDLLVRQAYSGNDMARKLRRKGFGASAVEQTLETLKRLGYIKDADYAEDWVDSRNRNGPRGKRLLRHELNRKGIDRTTIDRVLEDIDQDQELGLAKRAAEKQSWRYERLAPDVAQRRLYAFLQRRGFDSSVCSSVVQDMFPSSRSR